MPRKYKKSYGSRRPLKTVKYSNETSNITSSFSLTAGSQITAPLISESSIQGVRKAKNFSLKILYAGTAPLMFVLVYVPQKQKVGSITLYGLPFKAYLFWWELFSCQTTFPCASRSPYPEIFIF